MREDIAWHTYRDSPRWWLDFGFDAAVAFALCARIQFSSWRPQVGVLRLEMAPEVVLARERPLAARVLANEVTLLFMHRLDVLLEVMRPREN